MWYIWSVSSVLQAAEGLPWIKPILFPNAFVMPSALNTIDLFVSLVIAALTSPVELFKVEGGAQTGFKGLINAEFWIDTRATHNYLLNKGRVFENSLSYQS